jgi:hypothetical protein
MANTFLPFTAYSGFDLSFRAISPKHPVRISRTRRRLGASKEEKLATRQTEGRSGREVGAHDNACGKPAFCVMSGRALRHRRIAVPPAELSAR